MLDAPTGAGKTLIGEVVRQIAQFKGWGTQALYVCTTKTLQSQFLDDYPYAAVIKGRANYPTLDEPERFASKGLRHLDGGMCSIRLCDNDMYPACDMCAIRDPDYEFDGTNKFRHCHYCHPFQNCPYRRAKDKALHSELAVANTSYFLTEANKVGTFAGSKFPFMVVDEADTLESVLMSYVELSISRRVIDTLGVKPPKVTVVQSWREWVTTLIDKLKPRIEELEDKLEDMRTSNPAVIIPPNLLAEHERWVGYLSQCQYVDKSLADEPDNWVFNSAKDAQRLTLRPVTISGHAQQLFFNHSQKFLLMSATMISPHQMANDLGLLPEQWNSVHVGSTFPKERRPLHVRPTVSMTHKTSETGLPKLAAAVEDILRAYPEDRILIHTVSYDRARYLDDYFRLTEFRERIITYDAAEGREKTLQDFRRTPGAVLLAPSLERGVDLPYDACRVIVVAKVPFPNTSDAQVQRRLYGTQGGKSWYAVQTVRALVQMTGRGMRHADDTCTTFILDDQFRSNLWRNSRHLIPKWWTEALVWEAPT